MSQPESLALTQYNFLTNLVIKVLNDHLSEPLTPTNRASVFNDFILPGVRLAIIKHHQKLSPDEINNKIKTFVADLRISSESTEHMTIFLSVVDYTSELIGVLTKLPHKSTYETLTTLPKTVIGIQALRQNLRKFVTSNPITCISILTKFGEKQDIQNFTLFINKHSKTGKWDWDFFNKHKLMTTIMKGFEKHSIHEKVTARYKRIKETKDKLYRETEPTNPIDKFVWKIKNAKHNTVKTFKESEVVGKTVGFLFHDQWGPIIEGVLIVLAIGGIYTLIILLIDG